MAKDFLFFFVWVFVILKIGDFFLMFAAENNLMYREPVSN